LSQSGKRMTTSVKLKEALIYLTPFGLSLSKALIFQGAHFDKLKANGFIQSYLKCKAQGRAFFAEATPRQECFRPDVRAISHALKIRLFKPECKTL